MTIERCLLIMVLCALAPDIGWAQSTVAAKMTGNIAARRASVPQVVGGPAKYDAKKGAVVGGTVARPKR